MRNLIFSVILIFAFAVPAYAENPKNTPPPQQVVSEALSILEKNFYDFSQIDIINLYNSALSGANDRLIILGVDADIKSIPRYSTSRLARIHFDRELNRLFGLVKSPADKEQIAFSAVNKMLESVGDSHTFFLAPAQTKNWQQQMSGQAGDTKMFGFSLQKTNNLFYIDRVMPGSPFDQSGVQELDHLLGINDYKLTHHSVQDIIKYLEGLNEAVFEFKRNDEVFLMEIKKGVVVPVASKAEIISHKGMKIGRLSIYAFSRKLLGDLLMLSESFDTKDRALDGLIVDVRNNSGGYVFVLHYLLEQVLEKDVFAYRTRNNKQEEKIIMKRSSEFDCPLVILTNKKSFSASEVLASAIQENNRGVIIGERTGGSVGYGLVFSLPLDASMCVTVEQVLNKNGKNLEGVGVKEDFLVRQSLVDILKNRDSCIKKALDYFENAHNIKNATQNNYQADFSFQLAMAIAL